MQKLIQFVKKYDFPYHFVVLWDWHIVSPICVLFSSLCLRFKLSCFGCRFGKNLTTDGVTILRIGRRGALSFGDDCHFNSRLKSNLVGRTTPVILDCHGDGRIQFGNHCGCSFVVISSRNEIVIGDHVKIGGNVRIFDHDYHSLNYLDRRDRRNDEQNLQSRPVNIGSDVFIGTNAVILKGVTIGDRAVIGAGAVVTHNVPADEIWAGNPARFVKRLNNDQCLP